LEEPVRIRKPAPPAVSLPPIVITVQSPCPAVEAADDRRGDSSPSDQEIESFARDIVRDNGGPIAQDKGAKILRGHFSEAVRRNDPRFLIRPLMELIATVNGVRKPGPKGPRKPF
jgi:hypothetical protein